jgi:hypothetical protein
MSFVASCDRSYATKAGVCSEGGATGGGRTSCVWTPHSAAGGQLMPNSIVVFANRASKRRDAYQIDYDGLNG